MAAMPALVAAAALLSVATAPPNILFVVYDDLRPQLASYGHDRMSTPHFDSLANQSLVFNRAYTNYPYCAPSRNSFMSGRMPDHAHDWNFLDSFRQKDVHSNPSPNIGATWVALPEFFKNHGWWTVGSGKLYHPNLPVDNDNPRSWSENLTDYGGNSGCTCPSTPSAAHPHAPMFCALPENTSCPDVVITDTVVQQLQRWDSTPSLKSKPFFVGFGIHKPHLPWGVPASFFAQYEPVESIPLAKHKNFPQGAPAVAYHSCHWAAFPAQLGSNGSMSCSLNEGAGPANCTPGGTVIADTHARQARHGYMAAVSFADSLLGRVLAQARSMDSWDNTVTLLTSDHGWQVRRLRARHSRPDQTCSILSNSLCVSSSAWRAQ